MVDCPFVGLTPFTEEDSEFFFGRERDQRLIIANLFASRLTIYYGPSGVGKSSVLRAGVVKELYRRIEESRAESARPDVAVVYFNQWQGDVTARLRWAIGDAVNRVLGEGDRFQPGTGDRLAAVIRDASAHLGGEILVLFDQFEEYFLYHADESNPDGFGAQFAEAANEPQLAAGFLVSLRDDSLSKLDRFKPLIPNLFRNYLRLQHLSAAQARDAILKPVERYNEIHGTDGNGIRVQPELVDRVIEDVQTGRVLLGDIGHGGTGDASGGVETPYLQLVMTRLWEREVGSGSHELMLGTLDELGGAKRIVRDHLGGVMVKLSPHERDLCAKIFHFLVTPSGTKIAHSASDLAGFAGVDRSELEPVLEKLSVSSARILAPTAPSVDQPGQVRYEIYHDSLGRAVLEWRRVYVERQELAEQERVSREKEREAARFRRLTVMLGAALIVALIAGGFAVYMKRQADANAARADSNAAMAEENAARARVEEARAKQAEQLARAREADLKLAQAKAEGNSAEVARFQAQLQKAEQQAMTYGENAKQLEAQASRLQDQSQLAVDRAAQKLNALQEQLNTANARIRQLEAASSAAAYPSCDSPEFFTLGIQLLHPVHVNDRNVYVYLNYVDAEGVVTVYVFQNSESNMSALGKLDEKAIRARVSAGKAATDKTYVALRMRAGQQQLVPVNVENLTGTFLLKPERASASDGWASFRACYAPRQVLPLLKK